MLKVSNGIQEHSNGQRKKQKKVMHAHSITSEYTIVLEQELKRTIPKHTNGVKDPQNKDMLQLNMI